MQLLFIISILSLILASCNCEIEDPETGVTSDESEKLQSVKELTSAANNFAFNFYKAASATNKGNFVSPTYTTFAGMSLAVFGAQGKAKSQTRKVIQLPLKTSRIPIGFKHINDKLEKISKRTYLDMSMIWWSGYGTRNITESFQTAASNTYNIMVEDSMRVDPGSIRIDIDAYFTCVLADQESSDPLIFANSDGKIDIEQTIRQTGEFRYGELNEINATFVEISCLDPYDDMRQEVNESNGRSISMFIVLPNSEVELRDFENNIDKIRVEKLFSAERRNVDVTFPIILIQGENEIREPLEKIGVTVFSTEANLRNVAPNVKIDTVKTYTALGANPALPAPQDLSDESYDDGKSIKFTADRPFVSIIATNDEDPLILQIARYTDP